MARHGGASKSKARSKSKPAADDSAMLELDAASSSSLSALSAPAPLSGVTSAVRRELSLKAQATESWVHFRFYFQEARTRFVISLVLSPVVCFLFLFSRMSNLVWAG